MKYKHLKPKRRKEERKLRMVPWGKHNKNDLYIFKTRHEKANRDIYSYI